MPYVGVFKNDNFSVLGIRLINQMVVYSSSHVPKWVGMSGYFPPNPGKHTYIDMADGVIPSVRRSVRR